MAVLGILIAALWVSAFALCLQLLFPRFFKSRRRPRRKSPQYSSVSSPLHSRLLNMLNGDHLAAHRLVTFIQHSYPHRSQQWHLEKAIYDLERDRR